MGLGASNFIGITYLHLLAGLGVTAVSSNYPVSDTMAAQIVEIVLTFVLLFAMMYLQPGPVKYVLFVLFAVTLGQVLANFVARLKSENVLKEVLVTVGGIFLAMTALGFYDKQNILGFGSYLLAALIGLIVARLLLIAGAFGGVRASTLYSLSEMLSWFGAGLFSIFVAYDTQRIKEIATRLKNRTPDYVDASLGLFLDAINLFTSVGDIMDN
jgi:FtsH-binding integral membrane protein